MDSPCLPLAQVPLWHTYNCGTHVGMYVDVYAEGEGGGKAKGIKAAAAVAAAGAAVAAVGAVAGGSSAADAPPSAVGDSGVPELTRIRQLGFESVSG